MAEYGRKSSTPKRRGGASSTDDIESVVSARKLGKPFTDITSEAEDALKCYHRHGNIRKLKKVIERGVILGKGSELTLRDLGIRKPEERESQAQRYGVGEFPPLTSEGIDLHINHRTLSGISPMLSKAVLVSYRGAGLLPGAVSSLAKLELRGGGFPSWSLGTSGPADKGVAYY